MVQYNYTVTEHSISFNQLLKGGNRLNANTFALQVADTLADKKGSRIVVLDLRRLSSITDYFVVGTGESDRQIKALQEAVKELGRSLGVQPLHVEGTAESGWVILDYGDVVIHVFSPNERDYYRLEQLWEEAPLVVSIQ